jgi:RNA polymerase sigma factor (sigma-70 family)
MASGQRQSVLRYLRRVVSSKEGVSVADAQLLERFVDQRDEAAFELLVRRHGALVLGVCRRVLRDSHEAEDAFQATFLALARRASSIARHGSVGGWLYKVAFRAALEAKAQLAKRAAHERLVPVLPAIADTLDPALEVQWHEVRLVIDEEVNRLVEKYRLPFVLCYFEGKSNAEAARELGCPIGTIESRLTRARERLRAGLIRRGLTLSGGLSATLLTQKGAAASVPWTLVSSTVQAATAFASRGAVAAGVISTQVITLTEGVLRAMFLTKLKIAAVLVLAVGVLTAGVSVIGRPALAARQPDEKQEVANQSADLPKPEKTAPAKSVIEKGVVKKIDPAGKTITIQSVKFYHLSYPMPLVNTLGMSNLNNPGILGMNNLGSLGMNNLGVNNLMYAHQLQNNLYAFPDGTIRAFGPQAFYDQQFLAAFQAHQVYQRLPLQAASESKHKLAPHVKVTIDGKEVRLSDLPPKTSVQLTLDSARLVTRIEAKGSTMDGSVEMVDPTNHLVSIQHHDHTYRYDLASDTMVSINTKESQLSDLKRGMLISLQFSAVSPKTVVGIRADGPTVDCVVKAVDVSDQTISIFLKKEHLTVKDLPVMEEAKILLKGKKGKLGDLKPGMQVSLKMGADHAKNLVVGITQK